MLQRTLADLYYKFGSRLQEMLSSGGIQISNGKEYALSDVIDTIKHAFGGSPQIVCKKGSVEELRLCFDKELKVSSHFPVNISLDFVATKYYGHKYNH